jgi:membrane associated rhomboid family serine protease
VGIYDRDYYRQGGSGFRLRAPRTAVVVIILINVGVFAAELLTRASQQDSPGGPVVDWLSAHSHINPPAEKNDKTIAQFGPGASEQLKSLFDDRDDTLRHPWMWWQFLTCGFVHDPWSAQHILFNLLTLFFLGRDVEEWYGMREFIRLYLVMIVFASVVWTIATRFFPGEFPTFTLPDGKSFLMPIRDVMFGASGAIAGVVVLYALLFPRRTLLVMFVLPLPAWLVGALAVGIDVYGAMTRHSPFHPDQRVAFTAHLGGAAFALAYFNLHWNLGNAIRPVVAWVKSRSRPPLKVFKPDDGPTEHVTDDEVDRILTKIHREGEQSLTAKERRVMEKASREYRRRRDVQ